MENSTITARIKPGTLDALVDDLRSTGWRIHGPAWTLLMKCKMPSKSHPQKFKLVDPVKWFPGHTGKLTASTILDPGIVREKKLRLCEASDSLALPGALGNMPDGLTIFFGMKPEGERLIRLTHDTSGKSLCSYGCGVEIPFNHFREGTVLWAFRCP